MVRTERGASRQAGEARQGRAVRRAGLLLFLHHVSPGSYLVDDRSRGLAILRLLYRLLFMTYNGWVMLAVAVGAFVGYLAFGNSSVTKSAACH